MQQEQAGYWRSCRSVGLLLAARGSKRGIRAALAARLRGLAAATMLLLCLWGSVYAAPLITPLLTEDFNDGNDNGWTQINRSWHVIDGRYHLDGCYGCNGVPLTGNRDGFSYTHVDDPTWTDYTFEFTFDTTNAPSADNPDWAGTAFAHHAMVFFRAQGPLPGPFGAPTQYRVDFGAEESFGRAIDLLKYVNGDPTPKFLVIKPISDFPLLGTLIGTYTGKITVSGGHIQIFVNNQLVVDFTAPDPIPFGGIGLGATWEVNAWFDNVSVAPEFSPIVNDFVAFEPIPSTYRFTTDITDCPAGFVGIFSFDATLTNIGDSNLANLQFAVAELSDGNVLLTEDGVLGEGEHFSVPHTDGFTDARLSPGEFVDVPFAVCLQERRPFRLFVDVLGTVLAPVQVGISEKSGSDSR